MSSVLQIRKMCHHIGFSYLNNWNWLGDFNSKLPPKYGIAFGINWKFRISCEDGEFFSENGKESEVFKSWKTGPKWCHWNSALKDYSATIPTSLITVHGIAILWMLDWNPPLILGHYCHWASSACVIEQIRQPITNSAIAYFESL